MQRRKRGVKTEETALLKEVRNLGKRLRLTKNVQRIRSLKEVKCSECTMKLATTERQDEGETVGKQEQRECGTVHRSLSQKHQDWLHPQAKISPSTLPLPFWMINE